jgi:hypothetical protein
MEHAEGIARLRMVGRQLTQGSRDGILRARKLPHFPVRWASFAPLLSSPQAARGNSIHQDSHEELEQV